MKLIKCHIENFGKLNNKDFIFDEGLTSMCFGNGYGKSTLTSFIKAMLYGLKGSRANSKDFDDRRKYYPFSAGAFGGSLTVKKDGRVYTVERFFDVKSEVKDTLKVFSDGELTDALGEDIGQTLVGLDSDSFERVMLMNSRDASYGTTGGISARLWGDEGDGESFGDAYERLDARKRQLKAARGRGGEISQLDDAILSLNQRIENSEREAGELESLYKQRDELMCEIARLEKAKSLADARELIEERRRAYAYHLSRAEAKRAEIERILALYPAGVMSEEREAEIKELLSALDRRLGAREDESFSGAKEARLLRLREKIKDTERAKADLKELSVLNEKYKSIKDSLNESCVTVRFAERFSGREPNDAQIELQRKNSDECLELTKKADRSISRGTSAPVRLLMLASLLFLLSGVGLIFFIRLAGILLLSAAAIAFISSLLIAPRGERPGVLLKRAAEKESELCKFLAPFGYNTEGKGAGTYAFKLFLEEYPLYLADRQSECEGAQAKRQLLAEGEILKTRIRQMLLSYSYKGESDGELCASMEAMASELTELLSLDEEKRAFSARLSGIDADMSTMSKRLRQLITPYISASGRAQSEALTVAEIREITDKAVLDRASLIRFKGELEELTKEAEDYKRTAGLDKDSADIERNPDGMTRSFADEGADGSAESIPEKRGNLARAEQRISLIESSAEQAHEQKGLLLKTEEKRLELLEEYRMIELTMKALKEAEHTLSEKYIAPVRDRFIHYASRIEESVGDKYTMDRAFNIRFEAGGASRDERHLSQGQHAVTAIALRLSLIDAMYGDDGFIILDDPFAPLDEVNFKKARELIKKISKDRQIVYFTCHNSRNI